MSVPKAKKSKPLHSPDYRKGREAGRNETLELICALLMQDYEFGSEDVARFYGKICDWQSYINDPKLQFYISTVRAINKENGFRLVKEGEPYANT